MRKKEIDVLIIGGGLTGSILLLALLNQGYKVLLSDKYTFEEKSTANFDARSLALSPASVQILKLLKIWPLLEQWATPINNIHVSEQYHFGATRLRGEKENPLGYVIELFHIHSALQKLLNSEHVIAPAELMTLDKEEGVATFTSEQGDFSVKAQLIVAADGIDSKVRQLSKLAIHKKMFNQHAIVANIGLARTHGNCAYERFTKTGPLALLPMTDNRASLVWATNPLQAKQYQALKESDFLQQLQRVFGYRLGRFTKVGKRHIYPLQQAIMPKKIAWPLVFIGNAAHNLHPVAGQGFNLGLRDVATLAQCIFQYGLQEDMLLHYQQMRQADEKRHCSSDQWSHQHIY